MWPNCSGQKKMNLVSFKAIKSQSCRNLSIIKIRWFIRFSVQLRTTKVNKLGISGTRIFDRNLMADLKPDGQKELKTGLFILFPHVFGCAKILGNFFHLLRLRQLQQPELQGSSRHEWPSWPSDWLPGAAFACTQPMQQQRWSIPCGMHS